MDTYVYICVSCKTHPPTPFLYLFFNQFFAYKILSHVLQFYMSTYVYICISCKAHPPRFYVFYQFIKCYHPRGSQARERVLGPGSLRSPSKALIFRLTETSEREADGNRKLNGVARKINNFTSPIS